jgi:predicted nucleic acid-binding protein
MEFAIFGTSVWVNFSKDISNTETQLLETYLSSKLIKILVTPTIIQEFLMGLRTQKQIDFYQLHFGRLICLDHNWKETSIAAAKLYFDLRKKGITIRKSADCLSAQVAIANGVLLVHNDSDFNLIASGSALRVFA